MPSTETPLRTPSGRYQNTDSSNEDRLLTENPFVNSYRESPSNRQSENVRGVSSFASLNIFKDGELFLMDKRKAYDGVLLQGPRRLLRLCFFGTIIPVLLITIPLYVRLMLYPPYHYPMAPTDQRLLNQKSSSVWCQAQSVHMNGTFNAYLMTNKPPIEEKLSTHTMLRHLRLKDDVKEYWGFFLQKGSIITFNLCTRRDGAMLMIMRGLHNLRKCAWIGEDSGEDGEDENESSNESGEGSPEVYLDIPIVRNNSSLLVERGGHLVHMDDSLHKESAAKTSAERKIELDYYVQKAIELSKNKQEVFQRLDHHTKDLKEKEEKEIVNKKIIQNNDEKKNFFKNKINMKSKNIFSKELPEERISSSTTLDLMRLKRNLEEDPGEGAMELIDDDYIRQSEAKRSRQNSSYEVSNLTKELYLDLFHLPNGLVYQRGKVDLTTSNDNSNEEQRSSFSSSEEALTRCEGLLGLIPLYHNSKCNNYKDAKTNKIKYKIPVTGTYYFVFTSDNEVFVSDIYFNMTLERVVFDTKKAVKECLNQTDCSLPLSFWSNDQTVVTLPESDWDSSFVLDVTCQPRVVIYLSILIMIPMAILFCTLY